MRLPAQLTPDRLRRIGLPLVAILLLAGAIWFFVDGAERRNAAAAGDDAVRAARDSITAMLSYRPDTAGKELDAARVHLTGKFLDDYTQLIKTVVVPEATQKRITSAVQVPAAAAVSAQADRAVVLAFVDQTRTVGSAAPAQTSSSVRVSLEKVDGRWLIAAFEPI